MPRPRSVEDQELLPKVVLLFWRNGYARTGIRELEQSLGLTAPSLYNRFGSKEALFQAALAHYLQTVVRGRIERYLKAEDPLLGLRAFFDSTFETVRDCDGPLGCLLVNTSLEARTDVPPGTLSLLRRGNRMICTAIRGALLRAQQHGLLPREAHTGRLAHALQLGLQGLLVECRVERNKAVLRRKTDALFSILPGNARKE
jgi:TetR/AcrR family transcriptional regulator, transcriptional repressor for nem operon